MLRYITKLQGRDLSLAQSMIALGSCTMKLNATVEMIPVTWPELGKLHPFAPAEQARGYATLFADLESWLSEVTGFAGVSLQPNAGSQGEYAGLLVIRAYHAARGETAWRLLFIAGIIGGAGAWLWFAPPAFSPRADFPLGLTIAAGLLVGFGTRLGSGCTSGHGVCGIARLSPRSIVATLVFMAFGAGAVFALRFAGAL